MQPKQYFAVQATSSEFGAIGAYEISAQSATQAVLNLVAKSDSEEGLKDVIFLQAYAQGVTVQAKREAPAAKGWEVCIFNDAGTVNECFSAHVSGLVLPDVA
jgi:hypothetical protein